MRILEYEYYDKEKKTWEFWNMNTMIGILLEDMRILEYEYYDKDTFERHENFGIWILW